MGTRHCFAFSTGRAAMALTLSAMREVSRDVQRDEVIIPAYTCYSVASSVVKAGLKLRVCDVDERTLSYDFERLKPIDFGRVLAIVSANLYGLPNALPELERLASREGVYLLDDAAQSLNARVSGRMCGTFGAAGVLSLDKGKNITAMQGGMVITDRDDLAEAIQRRQEPMPTAHLVPRIVEYLKVAAYYGFLRPSLYWVPASLPMLRLGETRFEQTYPIQRFPAGLAPIALAQLDRLDGITERRVEVASWYRTAIPETAVFRPVEPIESAQPAFLRFPLRITDARSRAEILRRGVALGITGSYPRSIPEIPELNDGLKLQSTACTSAKRVAREIVTLPTHAFVNRADVTRIAALFCDASG